MEKDLWNKVRTVLLYENEESGIDEAISILIPYIKKSSINNYEKAKIFNLSIPYEDFYSNCLFEVWEGLLAFKKNNYLNLKNVVIYRINISEKKTWKQYKKTGLSSDANKTTYNSVKWLEMDFDISEDMNFENYLINKELFMKSLTNISNTDPKKAEIIKLLAIGYSSKEAFTNVYNTNSYNSKDRKKMERIKKQFLDVFLS